MMKISFISGLILGFSLFGKTLQTDNTTVAESAAPPTTTKAPENNSQSTNQPAGSSPAGGGGSQCQPHELLSENGCVDRDVFLNQVIMRSWKDEGFDKGKEAIGVVDASKCKADEVKTPFGCEKAMVPKTRNELRAPVVSSVLNSDNTVLHSSLGVRPSQNDHNVDDKLEQPKKRKKHRHPDHPVTGKDRPRKYVFLPGRRLRNGKRCRPNEVQGKKHRCIRRRRPKDSKQTTRHMQT